MALTISIEGKGVIANADADSDSAGGLWTELGGGTIGFNPDVYIYGSGSIGNQYASKSGWSYYDIGSGSELDFTASTGTEAGQFIYFWINIQSKGPFDTLANKGFAIRIGSSTTDYREFKIAGKNDSNGWPGGWKCFVLDPTKTGSVADTGTFDISSVRYFGVWIDTDVSVRADSIFLDQIAVGTGLRITGTSTAGWKDVVDYCTDFANRAWGMFEEREGVYYCKGKIYIGDATNQSANVSFADSGRVVKFETSEYYNAGSAWVSTVPTDAFGIIVEDHASYTTIFQDGVLVGSDNGRSGSTFIGSENEDIVVDLYGGNNAGSATLLYGTKLQGITGTFNLGNDTGHKMYGCTVVGCSQFDPVGTPVIKNCIFAETTDTDAALLWNENIDIQGCQFIANTIGAAIEHPSAAGTPYDYTARLFSGNTNDILNSSGSTIDINKGGGSNPSTYEGSTTNFLNTVFLTIDAPVSLVGAEIRIYDLDNTPAGSLGTELDGVESHSSATYLFFGSGSNLIWIQIMLGGYEEFGQSFIMPSSDGDFTALLQADLNA